MSIASSIAADHANRKRLEWVEALQVAYLVQDWMAVERLLDEMRTFEFSE